MAALSDKDLTRLHEEISSLARKYQLRNLRDPILSDLSVSQTYALSHLVQKKEMLMSELAESLNLSLSSATKIAKELERRKLITRIWSRKDARSVEVKPTKKGKEIHHSIHLTFKDHLKETLADISSSDREAVIQGLKVINRSIEEWQKRLRSTEKENGNRNSVWSRKGLTRAGRNLQSLHS